MKELIGILIYLVFGFIILFVYEKIFKDTKDYQDRALIILTWPFCFMGLIGIYVYYLIVTKSFKEAWKLLKED